MTIEDPKKPEILAPAGNKAAFLAALAAGTDAVYCGLRQFSARMTAKNFRLGELAALTRLAHGKGAKVYLAFNTIVKPGELEKVGNLLHDIKQSVKPDAFIIQDLSLVELAKQIGLRQELHLSTLTNVSFPTALPRVFKELNMQRVVLPRELNIDEIKTMAAACPEGLGLEVFVHGALCYAISGRCYWSSYFGGKSGLRGRCVQPCRRRYRYGGREARFFSCLDFSLDVLSKVLLAIPEIRAWKIEGRKKGPHYVYYTVRAYRMLRDQGHDPQMKKTALELLAMSLGRVGTHYGFLPQRPQNPVNTGNQTGSGLLIGHIQGSRQKPYVLARRDLLAGDQLRVGYEDDAWHVVRRVNRYVPKKGRLFMKIPSGNQRIKGTPVFLVDRQESHLQKMIRQLETEMVSIDEYDRSGGRFKLAVSSQVPKRRTVSDYRVLRTLGRTMVAGSAGVWLSQESAQTCPVKHCRSVWWWLPPVIWPQNEELLHTRIRLVRKKGARKFVLNAPWQTTFFDNRNGLTLWAGPFCNISNGLAVRVLKDMGFSGVIVSPELGREDYVKLPAQSCLPLGMLFSGNWPLCISRVLSQDLKVGGLFSSPRGEKAWTVKYGDAYWVYPNWKVDISGQRDQMERAGYRLFVHLEEPVPATIKMQKRPGLWNWKVGLP